MKRFICLVSLAAALLFCLCSCREEREIIGKWSTEASYEDKTVEVSYTFNGDGSGEYTIEGFYSDAFTYETDGDRLTISFPDGTKEYTVSRKKDSVVLSGEGGSVTYSKCDR